MRTIIAGGRKYRLTKDDYLFLDSIKDTITVVVSGMAAGADEGGAYWGFMNHKLVAPFRAQWDDINHPDARIAYHKDGGPYDANAGIRRNTEMAEYAKGGQCVLFPGGSGTADMARKAKAAGLKIHDRRIKS